MVEDQKTRALLVAGMHRSGTSSVTRVFNLLGVSLSEALLPPSLGNELGHWESARAVDLHEDMLRSAGVSWDSVLGVDESWFGTPQAAEFVSATAEFVKSDFENATVFAVKDPRLALFIPTWRRALGELGVEPLFVLPFRHPFEVARSLSNRQAHFERPGMWPMRRGALLWLRYVLTAERATRGLPRSFVAFDSLLTDWEGQVDRISRQIGISWPKPKDLARAEIDEFLDRERKHENVAELGYEPSGFSMWLQQVYDQLKACVDNPEAGAAMFDRAADALHQATELYGEYVRGQELLLSELVPVTEDEVRSTIIRELEMTNEALTLALSQEKQARLAREEQVRMMLNSTSWRLTSPIRKLKSLYR